MWWMLWIQLKHWERQKSWRKVNKGVVWRFNELVKFHWKKNKYCHSKYVDLSVDLILALDAGGHSMVSGWCELFTRANELDSTTFEDFKMSFGYLKSLRIDGQQWSSHHKYHDIKPIAIFNISICHSKFSPLLPFQLLSHGFQPQQSVAAWSFDYCIFLSQKHNHDDEDDLPTELELVCRLHNRLWLGAWKQRPLLPIADSASAE